MVMCPNCGQENLEGATQCATCSYPPGVSATSPAGAMSPGFQVPPGHPEYQPYSNYPPPPGGISYGMPVQVSSPGQLTSRQKTGRFFAGLGLGAIPVIVALPASLGTVVMVSNFSIGRLGKLALYVALGLFIAVVVLAIVFMTQPARRFLGYGMLTSVLALPIIIFISYIVVFTVECSISYC